MFGLTLSFHALSLFWVDFVFSYGDCLTRDLLEMFLAERG